MLGARLTVEGYDNPLYAALEVDYSESDQDPTGKAYEQTQKVSYLLLHSRGIS